MMGTEWHIPDSSIPVRQGDLMICRDPLAGKVREICLVITADCDISKGKFGRQLACLRVIPLRDYLRTIWAGRKLQRALNNEAEKIRSQLAKWHTRYIGVASSLSAEAATDWVRRVDPDVICNELQVPEPDRKKMKASLASFRSALLALADAEGKDQFNQLLAFRSAIQGKDCLQETAKQVQDESKSGLPEDVFLLPALPQLELGPAVVLLREIVAMPQEAVCYRAADAVDEDAFLRVGRLEPTFKYAVSQAFGTLYSRIGLPEDYERRSGDVLNQIDSLVVEGSCVA